QLRLLEPVVPALKSDVDALHEAESALGDDHNLAVLCDRIERDITRGRIALDLGRFTAAAVSCQELLRRKAVSAIHPLLDGDSGAVAAGALSGPETACGAAEWLVL